MKGRKAEIHALPGALDKPPPAPACLPKLAKDEWARVVPALVVTGGLSATGVHGRRQRQLATAQSEVYR
jgi:hypothetical protein